MFKIGSTVYNLDTLESGELRNVTRKNAVVRLPTGRRAYWAPDRVATGLHKCSGCGKPIRPGGCRQAGTGRFAVPVCAECDLQDRLQPD